MTNNIHAAQKKYFKALLEQYDDAVYNNPEDEILGYKRNAIESAVKNFEDIDWKFTSANEARALIKSKLRKPCTGVGKSIGLKIDEIASSLKLREVNPDYLRPSTSASPPPAPRKSFSKKRKLQFPEVGERLFTPTTFNPELKPTGINEQPSGPKPNEPQMPTYTPQTVLPIYVYPPPIYIQQPVTQPTVDAQIADITNRLKQMEVFCNQLEKGHRETDGLVEQNSSEVYKIYSEIDELYREVSSVRNEIGFVNENILDMENRFEKRFKTERDQNELDRQDRQDQKDREQFCDYVREIEQLPPKNAVPKDLEKCSEDGLDSLLDTKGNPDILNLPNIKTIDNDGVVVFE